MLLLAIHATFICRWQAGLYVRTAHPVLWLSLFYYHCFLWYLYKSVTFELTPGTETPGRCSRGAAVCRTTQIRTPLSWHIVPCCCCHPLCRPPPLLALAGRRGCYVLLRPWATLEKHIFTVTCRLQPQHKYLINENNTKPFQRLPFMLTGAWGVCVLTNQKLSCCKTPRRFPDHLLTFPGGQTDSLWREMQS